MKNKDDDEIGLQTKVLHEWNQFNETHAVTAPIWQTTTFTADSAEQLAELGAATHSAGFYTRYGNPTHRLVEATLAALEGGEAALVTSSGMGAIFLAVMSQLRRGDHVVAQTNHYAAASTLLRELLPRWGIDCTFVNQTEAEEFAEAIRPNTKLIYVESPSNPLLHLTDLRAVAGLAKERGITTAVDSTFATPVNQRPLALGIDVVLHSATKYLGGHHDLTAGCIVASQAFIEQAWAVSLVTGAVLSPFDAWLLLRGLKTLGLRVERQNQNALALAQFLEAHPQVERVYYPGLESHPQHMLARQQMSGFSGMMSIELKGGFEAAEHLIASLKFADYAVSLGGVETLITHPAAIWGAHHTPEQRRAAGISDSLVRISVGVEDERDLLADFAQALKR
jgi:cystathionine beta-lyase/cystathionine gamma-synthase